MTDKINLDDFTRAYIECALWSTNDESNEDGGEPLDRNYGVEDIAPETMALMTAVCAQFQKDNADDIGGEPVRAGHDFWLTRNRHGAGFWDGDWSEPAATRLTAASKKYAEVSLYIHDGRIYDGF